MPSYTRMWTWLVHFKSTKIASILGTFLLCLAIAAVPMLLRLYPFQKAARSAPPARAAAATATRSPAQNVPLPVYSAANMLTGGVFRLAQLHTERQKAGSLEVTQYVVQKGDTIFDIAKKFGIKPSTILWGNLETLADNPEFIFPDQKLNILPVDGVYYQWHEGDGLNGVSKALQVKPEDIIEYPGNHLSADTVGPYSHPNIKPGTWIIVPGGYRNFITWSAPTISRFSPGKARLYGPGACDKPTDGAVGTGTFTWPTVDHWLSGYDYDLGTNHPAVDVAGQMGNAIYAGDNGVIVYAGWNDWGFGNVTVIDHGNGYQSLYAHQSTIKVGCGQSVAKGELIGLMGSTGRSSGPHLHWEVRYNGAPVNPHDLLPFGAK